MTDHSLLTSYHESSHAVIGRVLGASIDLISIRAGKSHAGITFPASLPKWTSDAMASADDALPLKAADVRRVIEVRICLSLAGAIGERLAPFEPGYVPTIACPDDSGSLARKLSDLSPRHRELLEAAESETHHDNDETSAYSVARALGAEDEARALVELCRVVTRNLVEVMEREIHSVASELHRLTVLTGDEVDAAMAAAYPPIKRSIT